MDIKEKESIQSEPQQQRSFKSAIILGTKYTFIYLGKAIWVR